MWEREWGAGVVRQSEWWVNGDSCVIGVMVDGNVCVQCMMGDVVHGWCAVWWVGTRFITMYLTLCIMNDLISSPAQSSRWSGSWRWRISTPVVPKPQGRRETLALNWSANYSFLIAQQQVHLAGMRETERKRQDAERPHHELTSLLFPKSLVLCIFISMVAFLLSDLPFNSLHLSIASPQIVSLLCGNPSYSTW